MTHLAERIASACNCSDDQIQTIRWAGKLHDIGKMSIPEDILNRRGGLSETEWAVVRRHPVVGAEMVQRICNQASVAELIRTHHERFDGQGYPRGLQGDQIPLGARILAVADAFTAMTEERVFRASMTNEQAFAELKRCAGTHFDPDIVETFLNLSR